MLNFRKIPRKPVMMGLLQRTNGLKKPSKTVDPKSCKYDKPFYLGLYSDVRISLQGINTNAQAFIHQCVGHLPKISKKLNMFASQITSVRSLDDLGRISLLQVTPTLLVTTVSCLYDNCRRRLQSFRTVVYTIPDHGAGQTVHNLQVREVFPCHMSSPHLLNRDSTGNHDKILFHELLRCNYDTLLSDLATH